MESQARIWLDIEKIDQERSIQMREATDLETVAEYADALKAGQELPPVTVFRDGAAYFLADGWHRLKAHEATARKKIEVRIIKGSHREAALYAIGANASHGRRRTMADKEKAILYMLKDPEWKQLSDQELLRHAKITDQAFVRKVRDKYGVKSSNVKMIRRGDKLVRFDATNVGKNGRNYADDLKAMPYNAKLSQQITKVIGVLDEQIISKKPVSFSKESLLSIRRNLTKAVAELENRLIAKKINGRK